LIVRVSLHCALTHVIETIQTTISWDLGRIYDNCFFGSLCHSWFLVAVLYFAVHIQKEDAIETLLRSGQTVTPENGIIAIPLQVDPRQFPSIPFNSKTVSFIVDFACSLHTALLSPLECM